MSFSSVMANISFLIRKGTGNDEAIKLAWPHTHMRVDAHTHAHSLSH